MGEKDLKGFRKLFGRELDLKVFLGSAALALPFILLGGFSPKLLENVGDAALAYLTNSWSWLYLISVSLFVLICLVVALSPLGSVKLGEDDEKPEFGRWSWFAMLFSAGMGIGLIFWSIAEPVYHFMGPPMGEGETKTSAQLAFEIFFFHWGLHAWGTYVVVGLPMAYFQFRKGDRGTISRCLGPLFPDRAACVVERQPTLISRYLAPLFGAEMIEGAGGKLVDILAIWATIMGVVTSLGLGALQITSGLGYSFGLPAGRGMTSITIAVITLMFILSALSGVKRGIKYLSLLNVALMISMLLFFISFGPTRYLLTTFGQALTDYVVELVPLSTSLTLFDNPEWTRSWTVFYWAWWIAWAPFVGAFIASISRGRTIREFVLGVMILPALFSFTFSTVLGGTAVHLELFQGVAMGETVKKSVEVALFETLHHMPYYSLLAVLANVLIASFFITSADSATYVISRFSTGGIGASDTQAGRRLIIFWGLVLGGLAIVLIYSGGLKALQTASIIGAFPFMFIMYLLLVSIVKDLLQQRSR
jgi:glycine betaine transporter